MLRYLNLVHSRNILNENSHIKPLNIFLVDIQVAKVVQWSVISDFLNNIWTKLLMVVYLYTYTIKNDSL